MGPLNPKKLDLMGPALSVADGGTPWFADSHWQTMHKGNKAAKELEARWRKAIKNKSLTRAQLDVCAPCQMTGDAEQGYEPLREASVTSRHFPHSFALGSPEYFTWLQATDEL